MDESKKRYLFVKKVKIKDKYKTYIVTRHYEKELTQDELTNEIQDIQGEQPLSYAYMEISGDIQYQGIAHVYFDKVQGGRFWYVYDINYSQLRCFYTKQECTKYIKSNFHGEYRRACLMLLAHQSVKQK